LEAEFHNKKNAIQLVLTNERYDIVVEDGRPYRDREPTDHDQFYRLAV